MLLPLNSNIITLFINQQSKLWQRLLQFLWPELDVCARAGVWCMRVYIPVEEQQNGQHGLVDVAVADALVEQVTGVPDHRLQWVLSHDVVELICV